MNPQYPDLKIKTIGLVSRDYNVTFPNGYRDFSFAAHRVLRLLDEQSCDLALFSLYSLIPRRGHELKYALAGLNHLKMVCIEEFRDNRKGRKAGDMVIYVREGDVWHEHRLKQAFGRVNWLKDKTRLETFIAKELPGRYFGNTCLLVCGEINGVKYDKLGSKQIIDPAGLRAAIPDYIDIIINPQHDKTTRFEMPMKKQFLSAQNRILVSVWNKGRVDCRGKVKDGKGAAWKANYSGKIEYSSAQLMESGTLRSPYWKSTPHNPPGICFCSLVKFSTKRLMSSFLTLFLQPVF